MSGIELLNKIKHQYPEEKPVVFNYAEARRLMLALAGRVINLEALLPNNECEENGQ